MDLKVEVPELEPSSVLLEQLAQLSQGSVPSAGRGGGPKRALMAALSVTVIAGASWLTGTMPGVASPFAHGPGHGHAGVHAPAEPASDGASGDSSAAPGQAKAHHQDNGNHTGQTKPHSNSGNHTGQTKPHTHSGNHTGQTKPHTDTGNHTGQTKPDQAGGNGGNGGGEGNGHHT